MTSRCAYNVYLKGRDGKSGVEYSRPLGPGQLKRARVDLVKGLRLPGVVSGFVREECPINFTCSNVKGRARCFTPLKLRKRYGL